MAQWENDLLRHLTTARLEAELLASDTPDTGTCNFDSVFLRMPRKRKTTVKSAIRCAGLNGYDTDWLGPGYIIAPPGGGQAQRRTAKMEVMLKYLQYAGYDVMGYYQAD